MAALNLDKFNYKHALGRERERKNDYEFKEFK